MMTRKFPGSLSNAIAEIKTLRATLATALEQKDAMQAERNEARTKLSFETANRSRAEAATKESREQFADLKQRLLDAEKENSRLNGYLSRVHEDDVVRDGLVEIEDSHGRRMIPKRQPPMMNVTHSGAVDFPFETDTYGRQKPRTHWTSY